FAALSGRPARRLPGPGSDLLETIEPALRVGLLMCDLDHPRSWRACAQPGQQAVDAVGRALQQGLDRTVVQIAHPAAHASQMCLPHGGGAKGRPLHASSDADINGFEIVIVGQFLQDASVKQEAGAGRPGRPTARTQAWARSCAGPWTRCRFRAVLMIPIWL